MTDPIFITGGTGFLGSYLISHFVQQGFHVKALRRTGSSFPGSSLIEKEVEWMEGDLTDLTAIYQGVSKYDLICHAAAVVSFRPRDRSLMMKVNVEGTATLVNAALENQARGIIFISSVAAFGKARTQSVINEQTEWKDDPANTPYGDSKHWAEMELHRAGAEGLPYAMIRPSMILGEGFWDEGTGLLWKHAYHGMPFLPPGSTGWVDVLDVVAAVDCLSRIPLSGQDWILSAHHDTLASLYQKIGKVLGKERVSKVIPSPYFDWLAYAQHLFFAAIPGVQAPIDRDMIPQLSGHYQYDGSAFCQQTALNYRNESMTLERVGKRFLESYPNHGFYMV